MVDWNRWKVPRYIYPGLSVVVGAVDMGHIVIVAVAGIGGVDALGMDRRAHHGGDVSSGETCGYIGPVAVGLSGPDIGIGGAGVQFSFLDG